MPEGRGSVHAAPSQAAGLGHASAARPGYRGRFAPSPTGPLHFGSLLAAVASFADARAHGGVWLVRIEDLDRTREVAGAADQILRTLAAFGLTWDEPVIHQSRRTEAYREALARLTALDLTFHCGCSRADIARHGRLGVEGPIYPGTCRGASSSTERGQAIRFRVGPDLIRFVDRIQGEQCQRVAESVGDFVLRRADGIHAYQLAVVVDDAWQGINRVVRGADLLLSTPRQLLLQQALGLHPPDYAHVPLILDDQGRKLSKSLAAAPVDVTNPLPALRRAWTLLGQTPIPAGLGMAELWDWAIPRWSLAAVPARTTLNIGERASHPCRTRAAQD
ncbi:MAG: tRNA glutamyl-Q(34) synthetase GluQRS [Sphingobacteriia bacterium]|nr:tRNA glutamyl-Q(34) synthetase GluQRS [Sphingobacteriia bacterium]NCC39498.1 tRNA glutamyl-Q(34) synthetase GluQRS [Gammaproteobacteria bacterium]